MLYVAMLRGIGPGNPKMSGASFKAFFEELGFTKVQPVLASGNIIFESSNQDAEELAEIIERAMPGKLGFSRKAVVRSQAELKRIIELDPFKDIEDKHNKGIYLLVTFFRDYVSPSFELPYTPDNKPYTLLGSLDRAIYGSVDLSETKTPDYMAWLEKQFGKDITSRTPKTIRLILSRMDKA